MTTTNVFCASAAILIASAVIATEGPVVRLNARDGGATLPAFWNGGAVAVASGKALAPSMAIVAGRNAVLFDGVQQQLESTFKLPSELTGTSAFTVAVWAFNTSVGEQECMVQWGRRGTAPRCAQLNYGVSQASGATVHWGSDMGYGGGVPVSGAWHHIAVTYPGGREEVEKVYVDGVLNTGMLRAVDVWPNGRLRLGSADNQYFFSGALSGVQMYDRALAAGDIAGLAKDAAGVLPGARIALDAAGLAPGAVEVWQNKGSLGGALAPISSSPEPVDVGARRGLQFGDNRWMTGTVNFANNAKEFTVVATVYNDELAGRETVLSLVTADGTGTMHFGYGSEYRGSAFAAGPGAEAGYGFSPPKAGEWHTLAWTYDGKELRVYVDGELASAQPCILVQKPSFMLVAGSGWDMMRRTPALPFSGAIGVIAVYDRALEHRDVRNACGLANAFNPKPGKSIEITELATTLIWQAGTNGVASFAVYFGTDAKAVAVASAAAATLPAVSNCFSTGKLDLGGTYCWRVDQLDAQGKLIAAGEVWSFTVDAGRARCIAPRNRTANTPSSTTTLQWEPGRFATAQAVYFGTNEQQMATATVPVTKALPKTAGRCDVPVKLAPGGTYYWRVDSENGVEKPTRGAVWSFRTQDAPINGDVTFFLTSDSHYVLNDPANDGNRATIDFMNMLPGTMYPKELGGGIVRTPRGVLHCGDTTDGAWDLFAADFTTDGSGRLCYPVYESMGNHDGGPSYEGAIARTKTRPGLTAVSSNGLHYSYDWDQVHLVCMNLYGSSGKDKTRGFPQDWNDPRESLDFVKKDLAEHVGNSGKPVVLYQHYGWDGFSAGWGWWSSNDRARLYQVISNYNVVAIFHGHTHGAYFQKWAGKDFHITGDEPKTGIDIVSVGSSQRGPGVVGECFVVNITSNEMRVAHRFADHWGISWRKPIKTPDTK